MDKIELQPGDEILDASAGTGILAEKLLAEKGPFQKLVLNDPSRAMLEQARYRTGNASNVEYCNLFAEELTFAENSFSHILCLNSFHYYVNQSKVLSNFRRFLKPGGSLWLLDWNRKGTFKISNAFISLLSPENINTRTLSEMKQLLGQKGFSVSEEEDWSFRWWNFFFIRCG